MAGRRGQVEANGKNVERFFQFSLLGMLVSGYCAILGSKVLDWPSAMLAGAALLARGLIVAGAFRPEIPARWVNGITVAYALFFPLDYFFLSRDFLNATVHLVFFVAIVKLVTAESGRDFFFLEVIAFLELLAASIVSTNANFFVFLVLFLFFSIATFASAEIRRAGRTKHVVSKDDARLGRRLSWMAVGTGAGILIITVGLFFVLPRTARAALEKFANGGGRVAGFANEVTLGQMGEIRPQGGPVMHVLFEKVGRSPAGLKWRGNALGEFDGVKWYNTYQAPRILLPDEGLLRLVSDEQLYRKGPRISYEVWLHTAPSDALFIAGLPEHIRIPAERVNESPAGALRLPLVDAEGFRYAVWSYLGGPATIRGMGLQKLPETEREHYLRLPPVDRRVMRLAESLTSGRTDDLSRARAIENYLRTQLTYSLQPLDRQPEDPLADFLFDRKKGHCEYFASVMAVMLRLSWIPSRVVTGFQGGEFNPLTGWHVVRASDAHAWVEGFIPGRGWIAFDPTPADPNPPALTAWSRLGMWMDALDVFWQEWVLGYDLDRQMTLAFQVDQSRRRFSLAGLESWFARAVRNLKRGASGAAMPLQWLGVLLVGGVIAIYFLRHALRWLGDVRTMNRVRRGEIQRGDAASIYLRMQAVLRRRGFTRRPGQTPMEFARALPEAVMARAVEEFTIAYHAARYGGRTEAAARMTLLLDRIEHLPRS